MVYAFLTDPIENRLIDELRRTAEAHPIFRRMVPYIRDSFAIDDVPQEGIYIEDVSGSHFALTSHNFIGTQLSHVFAAQVVDQPQARASESTERPPVTGSFVEWAREDRSYYIACVTDDVSDQVGTGTDLFQGSETNWIRSAKSLNPAMIHDVRAWVNGQPAVVREVFPGSGQVRTQWVQQGSTVTIKYTRNRLPEAPGLYYMRIDGENLMSIRYMGLVRNEVLVEEYDLESEFQLANPLVILQSLRVYTESRFQLRENVHYTVDYDTGKITVINPIQLPKGKPIFANYRFDGGQRENLSFADNETNNKLIPGAAVAISDRHERDAVAVVGVLPERVDIADIYGGRWDMSASLMIYARDPDTRQQIVDWMATSAIAFMKERLDAEGITFQEISIGGKTRIPYQEGAEDYFGQSITIQLQTDWEVYRSYPLRIEGYWIGQDYISDVAVPTPFVGPIPVSSRELTPMFDSAERYI